MISIKKDIIEEMVEHSIKEFPNEACGILVGKGARAEKIYKMTNTEKSPTTFFMDPKEQLNVMKEIRNLKLQMVGIYHSHVATEAYPSAHDVELAYYPEASFIIVSIKNRDNPSIRSFKIVEGKITEEEVKII